MAKTFDQQVVLITGAGSGIGRQLAKEFSARGAIIASIDLSAEPQVSLLTELKHAGAAAPVGAWEIGDVTSRSKLKAAVDRLVGKLGPIDILVANAGIGIENRAATFSGETFEKQIAVNLLGVANSVEMVLGKMIERRKGHIVCLSSLASYRGLPFMAGYCASKAGASALMDSLRVELKPLGVRCTTICPGWIKTPLVRNIDFPMPDLMSVEDAVARMIRAIERKKEYAAFPAPTRFLLSLQQVLPLSVGDWLMKKFLERMSAATSRSTA